MTRNLIVTALTAVIITGFVLATRAVAGSVAPPVKAYAEGQEVRFIHTEASDPKIADLLTKMKDSPVVLVPSLAQAPEAMLANVYVFKNGARGGGPLGYQPDVFDNPPGTPGYSPLRRVNVVAWQEGQSVRVLKSDGEVKDAEARGQITVERTGVVVNMPMLTWPGGKR